MEEEEEELSENPINLPIHFKEYIMSVWCVLVRYHSHGDLHKAKKKRQEKYKMLSVVDQKKGPILWMPELLQMCGRIANSS